MDQELKALYPSLNDTQLQEASANLERYLALSLRVYERICKRPGSLRQVPVFDKSSSEPLN